MMIEAALPTILAFEGGKVDDPADMGGRTNHGITQRTYDAWRKAQHPPLDALDVWLITDQETRAIYTSRYWSVVSGDDIAALSTKLALCVFDGAVNHGVGLSSRLLQRVLGIAADGVIGPQTVASVDEAIKVRGESAVVADYLTKRRSVYENIITHNPTQEKFRRGWRNRISMLCIKCGIPSVWPADA